jgi:hypothetical protein
MTNKEIKEIKQELYKIQSEPEISKQLEPLKFLANKIGASIPLIYVSRPAPTTIIREIKNEPDEVSVVDTSKVCPLEDEPLVNEIIRNIHTVLQTEVMFNTCVLAKWSCFWAAIAAIASCISVLLVLFCAQKRQVSYESFRNVILKT